VVQPGLFYYVYFITNLNPAYPRMQDILTEVDLIIGSPVQRKCSEWFLPNSPRILVDGGHHTTATGFDTIEIKVIYFEMFHLIFLVRRPATEDDVWPEPVHGHLLIQPAV
jgi:hypothetical protein